MERSNTPILIEGMSNEDYHDDTESISSTGLKMILTQSPAHYKFYLDERIAKKKAAAEAKAKLEEERAAAAAAQGTLLADGAGDGATTPADDGAPSAGVSAAASALAEALGSGTEATGFGTATHALLLEPEAFREQFIVTPVFDRRTKKGKADHAAFLAAHVGKQFVSQKDYETIERIIHNIRRHKMASRILEQGKKEASVFWTDRETGVRLRIRPDCIADGLADLDLKSTKDASYDGFFWEAKRYRYDLSAAMYRDGWFELSGDELPFMFLAVEKTGPCACALYAAPDAMLADGYADFRKAVRIYSECMMKDEWPDYQPDGLYVDMKWVPRYR